MKRILLSVFVLLFSLQSFSENEASRTAWFKDAKFGVFVHYLGGGPQWNQKVDSFNVKTFTDQIKKTNAGYLVFTLGQNSGYYCSPNEAYEKYVGCRTGERCSKRDLPMEIANELESAGIRLMLYLPSRSPQDDQQAMDGLGDIHEYQPAPQTFTERWSNVIREWSLRYGAKASGWWFDGAYNSEGWDDPDKPNNWRSWAAACRAGNPGSILAFNRGADIKHAFIRQTSEQDYTAGEQREFRATPASHPAPPGIQWHVLSFLGSEWSRKDGPRYTSEYMIQYIRQVNLEGGVVSIDVNCADGGAIYAPHLDQLISIGKGVRLSR